MSRDIKFQFENKIKYIAISTDPHNDFEQILNDVKKIFNINNTNKLNLYYLEKDDKDKISIDSKEELFRNTTQKIYCEFEKQQQQDNVIINYFDEKQEKFHANFSDYDQLLKLINSKIEVCVKKHNLHVDENEMLQLHPDIFYINEKNEKTLFHYRNQTFFNYLLESNKTFYCNVKKVKFDLNELEEGIKQPKTSTYSSFVHVDYFQNNNHSVIKAHFNNLKDLLILISFSIESKKILDYKIWLYYIDSLTDNKIEIKTFDIFLSI